MTDGPPTDIRRWYLSFVDPKRDIFLGSAIIDAYHADLADHAARLCPTGEASHVEIPAAATLPPYVTVGQFAPLADMIARGEITLNELGPNTRRHWWRTHGLDLDAPEHVPPSI